MTSTCKIVILDSFRAMDHAPKPIGPCSLAVRANGFLFAAQIALGRVTCALVFFLGVQLSQPKPLTKAEVLSLVASWPVAVSTSTQHLIQQRGISFSPTDEYGRMLDRASGGTSASLEETLHRAKVRPLTEAEAPNESALLQHLTRCGELNNSQSAIPHSSEAEVECRAALSLDPRNPFVLLAVGSSLEAATESKGSSSGISAGPRARS